MKEETSKIIKSIILKNTRDFVIAKIKEDRLEMTEDNIKKGCEIWLEIFYIEMINNPDLFK